jgi:hypothetical protein
MLDGDELAVEVDHDPLHAGNGADLFADGVDAVLARDAGDTELLADHG